MDVYYDIGAIDRAEECPEHPGNEHDRCEECHHISLANAEREAAEALRIESGELCPECRNTGRDPNEPGEPCTWCAGGRRNPVTWEHREEVAAE